MIRSLVVVALALLLAASPKPPLDAAASEALHRQIDRTLEAHRWREALGLIDRYLDDVGREPVLLYNKACCHAQLDEKDAAGKALLEAIKAGFRDFETMEADPDLEPIHATEMYTAILEARDRVAHGEHGGGHVGPKGETLETCPQSAEWRRTHGDKDYHYEDDAGRRLHYATCLDDESHREMRTMIEREADWLAKALFNGVPPYHTLIAVPTPKDAKRHFADPLTTGVYDHAKRMLVARDTGESLQHEFVHLMHYGHMERLHQKHPIWVQEGIACLFESYELKPDGSIRFLPNMRHNIARRAAMSGASMPWKELFAIRPDDFMTRAQALYPESRSIFEFLTDRGKLEQFYQALIKTYRESPNGVAAMESIFGRPLSDIERTWKDWLKARGAIDDSIGTGDASLGITISEEADGVRLRDTLPRSAARAAGMRIGDVIVSVDGKPVRSSRELALTLATRKVGDTITVRFRRDGEYGETPVTLRPLQTPRLR